ncbi:hypothetical protein [Pseudobacteriovorax antillogorgiicola]|uniref:hypothetical protein n=1 Tax=Pseudobacteriovorax antillogorgiicola TaxID=1513793 RepID=UPI0013564EF8|nr:hypothetical protein [Pseudobacteriovorax antillogorgiicola]
MKQVVFFFLLVALPVTLDFFLEDYELSGISQIINGVSMVTLNIPLTPGNIEIF